MVGSQEFLYIRLTTSGSQVTGTCQSIETRIIQFFLEIVNLYQFCLIRVSVTDVNDEACSNEDNQRKLTSNKRSSQEVTSQNTAQ